MVSIIDWFVSKIGMLVFVVVALGLLIGFAVMQMGVFEYEKKIRTVEDVARLIDAVADGGYMEYKIELGNYTLEVDSSKHSVSVDGVERFFRANVSDSTITNKETISIESNGGAVSVS